MMESIDQEIYRRLDQLGIPYRVARHPLAHTMEDLTQVGLQLGAVIPKNLFLTPRNQSAFYLCLVAPQQEFRTARISKQIGSSRLSFATAQHLESLLHTHPGAVSPMGLLFPQAAGVSLLVDQALKDLPWLGFHPNDNAQTLAMSGPDFFLRFLPATGHSVTWVRPDQDLPG